MSPPSTVNEWPPPSAYDQIVTLIVGKHPAKSYSVHKGILAFYSGGFAEATRKEIKLPDTEPGTFDAVQNWLYSRQLQPAGEKNMKEIDFTAVAQIWVFADAHDMPALQNAAITLMHEAVVEQWRLPTNSLNYIYENTVATARLRLYCIDVISKCGLAEVHLKPGREILYPKDALVDMLRAVWTRAHASVQAKEVVKAWDLCQFHVHEDGNKCTKRAV